MKSQAFEANLDRKILAFVEKAPKYGGDPKEVRV